MELKDGTRVRFDKPQASWHGREGVVVNRDYADPGVVRVVFDKCYTVCYVGESELIVLDDDKEEEDLPDGDWK